MRLRIVSVLALVLLVTGAAWAANPDRVAFTSISTAPSSTQSGQSGNYVLSADVNAGDTISLTFTVGASGSGSTSTTYPDTLNLTASTAVPSGAMDVTVTGLANCTLSGRTASCSESATITAPTTPGAYQIKILADDGRISGKMNSDFLLLNFTVVIPSCTPAATTLDLATPDCTYLHAGSVSLAATLKSDSTPLVGKTITFYIDGGSVGTADTDANGVATLTYDPSSLSVGDHVVSAAWQSDDACYQDPTVTGSKLGIEYLFIGFQQPINADGSSIFTGKVAPVKIRISDGIGAPVTDAIALVYFDDGIQTIIGTDPENVANSINFDYGNLMRYDPAADQYVYNWDLSTAGNGTKTVQVYLGEGSCAAPRLVVVSVKRKK